MENAILQMMVLEQIHTLILCALLIFASCAYIAILPWNRKDLEKCHSEFKRSLGFAKYYPVLSKERLLKVRGQ